MEKPKAPFSVQNTVMIGIADQQFQVKYPNVGQLLEIENKKMFLSAGEYGNYVGAPIKTISMQFVIDLIDALAHFSVLIPGLSKKLSVSTYLEIDAMSGKALVDAYKKQFEPWYNELVTAMHKNLTEEKSDEQGADAGGN